MTHGGTGVFNGHDLVVMVERRQIRPGSAFLLCPICGLWVGTSLWHVVHDVQLHEHFAVRCSGSRCTLKVRDSFRGDVLSTVWTHPLPGDREENEEACFIYLNVSGTVLLEPSSFWCAHVVDVDGALQLDFRRPEPIVVKKTRVYRSCAAYVAVHWHDGYRVANVLGTVTLPPQTISEVRTIEKKLAEAYDAEAAGTVVFARERGLYLDTAQIFP